MEHTSFIMRCELKASTPDQVIETLKYMVNPDEIAFANHPDHPFFETEEWEYVLWTAGGALWDPDSKLDYDEAKGIYNLNVRTSVKDSEGQQVESFLYWIAPYSATEGFVWDSHPEYNLFPTRILFENGHAFLVDPVENNSYLEDYIEPVEDNRYDNLVDHLQQMAQANPEMAQMFKNQMETFEKMNKNNPDVSSMLNDPQARKMFGTIGYFPGKDENEDKDSE